VNKKLLAAAVAATVAAAPSAFAEQVIYGKFHTSVDKVDIDDSQDNWAMASRSSRLGFKGSEDLGNGLRAIYQAEFSVQTDGNDGADGQDGGDGWGGQRNTFVGLAGGFGTFLVGRHDTPMKVAFYGSGNERLGDSILDLNTTNSLTPEKNNAAPIGVFSEYRADNVIAYITPNFSGFSGAFAVIPGEDSGVGDPPDNLDRSDIADHYSIGVMYAGGGLKASAGWQNTDLDGRDGDRSTKPQKTWQAGGSYTFGAYSIGGQYEATDNYRGQNGNDYTAWAVTGKATFGNNAISLIYTNSDADASEIDGVAVTNLDTDGWGIAAEHNFSKRTKVYAAYAADSRDLEVDGASGDQDADVFSLGMIHSF
jgi:predicted porin